MVHIGGERPDLTLISTDQEGFVLLVSCLFAMLRSSLDFE